jgi:hypothetical protein
MKQGYTAIAKTKNLDHTDSSERLLDLLYVQLFFLENRVFQRNVTTKKKKKEKKQATPREKKSSRHET